MLYITKRMCRLALESAHSLFFCHLLLLALSVWSLFAQILVCEVRTLGRGELTAAVHVLAVAQVIDDAVVAVQWAVCFQTSTEPGVTILEFVGIVDGYHSLECY